MLFPSWILDTKSKYAGSFILLLLLLWVLFVYVCILFYYVGGCIATFLFGMFVEFLAYLRARTKDCCQPCNLASASSSNSRFAPLFASPTAMYAASIIILGLQATCGYFLMFLAMTFSVPIFMCAVFGLMVGHGVFNLRAHGKHAAERPHC